MTNTRLLIGGLLLAVLVTSPCLAQSITLDAKTIGRLESGDSAVDIVSGDETRELVFHDPGLELATEGRISTGSGGVEFRCRVPDVWPPENDQALFHTGDRSNEHITLFFRAGSLAAVYKADIDHYFSLRFASENWEPGSVHQIEYSWDDLDDEHVQMVLRVDDELIGTQQARRLQRLPEMCFVGGRGRTGSVWSGRVLQATISPDALPIPEFTPGQWKIVVEGDETVGTMYNFWSINNYTSEDMFANPLGRKPTAESRPYMKCVNTVRLLGGRDDGKNVFFQGVDAAGEPICDFTLLKKYIGGMLDWGYTPRIVLDNVPNAMSPTGEFNKYGNTAPAKDVELWAKYVEQVMRALVDEFGFETVSSWRIRAGTEPDLFPGHWSGTKEEYLEHYDWTVDAVCRVIPNADIGPGNILNPAKKGISANGRKQWGLDIIDHAATGRNHVTGKTGTRLRHFASSWYGQVGRPIDSFDTAILAMRNKLDEYPQFRDVPVEIAEFSVLTDDQGRRMSGGELSEWGASWYAAIADRAYRLNVAQIHNWGGSWQNLRYAHMNVMEMLTKMEGGERVRTTAEGTSKAKCGAVACRQGESLFVMLYNHRPMRDPKVAEKISLTIRDPRMTDHSQWLVSHWQIDEEHGTFIHAYHADCEAAGLEPDLEIPEFGGTQSIFGRYGPESRTIMTLTKEKYAALSQLPRTAHDVATTIHGNGLNLNFEMPGHSVWLVEFRPADAK